MRDKVKDAATNNPVDLDRRLDLALDLVTGTAGAALIGWYVVVAARLTQAIMLDLRKRIFLHTQRLSLEFHESYTSGRIISRQTSDLDTIRELLDGGLNELVSGVLFGAFTLIALFLVDWQSGLIVLFMGIPLALLMRWFYRRSQLAYRESRVISAKVIVKFVETMTGIRAVKAFRKEVRNDDEFGELASDYRDVNMRTIRLFGTFEPGLIAISAVSVSLVLLWGCLPGGGRNDPDRNAARRRALRAQLLLAAAGGRVLPELVPVRDGGAREGVGRAGGGADGSRSGEAGGSVDRARPHPVRRGASSGTANDRVILPDFSLDIPAGADDRARRHDRCRQVDAREAGVEVLRPDTRLASPSTASTCATCIRRTCVARSSWSRRRRTCSAAPSPTTSRSASPTRRSTRSRRPPVPSGRMPSSERLPDGYGTDVNKRGGRVSAGQRQLISFARAFLANPSVLILDEATASLDIPSERMIQDALQTLLSDRTAIIIAHRLSTVAIADRVLVMEHGRIIEDDSPENLIGGDGRFAKLHAAWRESLV